LAIALLISRIPYLRVYFSLVFTLLHEVIRVCLEGAGSAIKLQKDGTSQKAGYETSKFKQTLIVYAGYTGTSLASIGLFYLVSVHNYQLILYLFITLLGVSLVFWIRNFFGFIWALTFSSLLAIPIYFQYGIAVMHLAKFLAAVILIQSVLNALQLCRQSFVNRKNPQRTGLRARLNWIPSLVVGVILLCQTVYASYFIVINFTSINLGLPWYKLIFLKKYKICSFFHQVFTIQY
jgi:hypothetical protein